MTANKNIDQFNHRLDQILGILPGRISASDIVDSSNDPALEMAQIMIGLRLETEAAPRTELRLQVMQKAARPLRRNEMRTRFALRTGWIAALLLALSLLFAFRQPVLASVGRIFGYIFLPDVGFLPAESTLLLKQPVMQEHDGDSVTVIQGVITPQETSITLEYSGAARPADGAWLEMETGDRLNITFWRYSPDDPGSHWVKMTFPTIPSGTELTTLVLPEGWRLPLTWVPALQAGVGAKNIVPFPGSSKPLPDSSPCSEAHGFQLCVLAATSTTDQTVILVEGKSLNGNLLVDGSNQGVVWRDENAPIKIETGSGAAIQETGNMPSLQSEPSLGQEQLVFPALPAGEKNIELIVPAVIASVSVDQAITVNVGTDPQPSSVIPINADIQVLDTTIHFRKATFVGDGINSLRLTLDSEPIEPGAITPVHLEMGKPERIDDLYGWGNLSGNKDLFVELIRPAGKITGSLTLPIVRATVRVEGPFQFTFAVSQTVPETLTPASTGADNFLPEPGSTPIPLEGYYYGGQLVNAGDLLYSVLDGGKTSLYAQTPGGLGQSNLIATLPGNVYRVYIHPDRQGLDYLTGTQSYSSSFYYQNIQLYTLRFGDNRPRLLYAFPKGSDQYAGTQILSDWSFNGRYMVFRSFGLNLQPGGPVFQYGWFDMACRDDGICDPHSINVPANLDLQQVNFSPGGNRLLFYGSDPSETIASRVFVMEFDPGNPGNPIVAVPGTSNVGQGVTWLSDGGVFALCSDGMVPPVNMFCVLDLQTGTIDYGGPVSKHLHSYRPSQSGDRILGIVINHEGNEKGLLEIRSYNWAGKAGLALTSDRALGDVIISPSDQYAAYVSGDGAQLNLIDLYTNNVSVVYTGDMPGAVSWLGWVEP